MQKVLQVFLHIYDSVSISEWPPDDRKQGGPKSSHSSFHSKFDRFQESPQDHFCLKVCAQDIDI